MITGQLWEMGDAQALERLDAAAVRLLVRAGARIEHDGLLGLLEGAGCRIVRSESRCYFTEKLIREALSCLGGSAARDVRIESGWDPLWRLSHSGSQPHLLEWPSGKRRLATCQDVIDMAKMAHMLDEFHCVGKVLTCCEVDQRIEPLWTNLAIARTTDKPPASGEVFFAEQIDPLVRMAEIITGQAGDTCLIPPCDFFVQPLILERHQAGCFLKKRQLGMKTDPGTMAVGGISAPITPASVVALSMAELMAGWVLGYLINPDLPAGGVVCTASLDMRSMHALFGSPEAILQNVATANAVRRLYGIEVSPIVSYTDCKVPGLQAAFDKMYGLLTAPFGTFRGIGTEGILSAGQDYSPVQHLLDNEMNQAVQRFWGHFEVDDDTLATELIEEMMRQPHTNFLTTDHTLFHFEGVQWQPRWLDRTAWRDEKTEREAEEKMLWSIDNYCRKAVSDYTPPPIDAARIRELEHVVAAGESMLLR